MKVKKSKFIRLHGAKNGNKEAGIHSLRRKKITSCIDLTTHREVTLISDGVVVLYTVHDSLAEIEALVEGRKWSVSSEH